MSEINTRFFSQTLSPTNYQALSGQKLTKTIEATPLQATHLTPFSRRTVRQVFAGRKLSKALL